VQAVDEARSNGYEVIIIDTAGRLHIDDEMMDELKRIKDAVNPAEILLVADAMTGQDAVNVAGKFNELLGIDGVIMTKMDGDARGGAALSLQAVIGKPIKFIGVGEKIDALEVCHPERLASRILGMGDILTFVERHRLQWMKNRRGSSRRKSGRMNLPLRISGPIETDQVDGVYRRHHGHDSRIGKTQRPGACDT